MTDRLTPRESRFVGEYLKDGNAAGAAARSGYSKTSAASLIRRPAIVAAIEAEKKAQEDRLRADADELHLHLSAMLKADIAEIMEDGHFKPIVEWPLHWRRMLQDCQVEERYNPAQNGEKKWDISGRVVRVKFIDRLRALELLGRHIRVAAFSAPQQVEETPQEITISWLQSSQESQATAAWSQKVEPKAIEAGTPPKDEPNADVHNTQPERISRQEIAEGARQEELEKRRLLRERESRVTTI